MPASRVAITGATGYLGSVLAEQFSTRGDEVIALTRRPPERPYKEWRSFNLSQSVDSPSLRDVDVLIHAAWVLSGKDKNQLWQENVVGSRKLLEAAAAARIPKIVFISSMSAYFGTRQTYGVMKLAVERTALDLGCVVIRPGLVYGDTPRGMGGTLQKVSRLPVWPRFRSAGLFVAHENDVALAMWRVLETYDGLSGRVIGFANPQPRDLSSILASLSPGHNRRASIPIPAAFVMALLRLLEAAGAKLPFRSDSLLGLVESANTLPGQGLLAERGITFRALNA
jgi:nucleoside-diphosphate-sugar epimerase